MSAPSPASPPAHLWGAEDAALRSMRRAALASAGVAAVVTADTVWRALDPTWPVLLGYSLLIWAVPPALVTLVITFVVTLASDVELPMWSTAGFAALATGGWMGWALGPANGGVAYGVVIAAGVLGVGLVLGSPRRLRARVLLASLVAAVTALLAFLCFATL
ncbi:hypothetical protein AAG589_11050 [Isoptericola sp. F-RaC21]|uniref:hypothetical protein n=1 Tax=Isoptericola sp. F-RaC21 TaxID=3141452 RepID=UPI00315C2402